MFFSLVSTLTNNSEIIQLLSYDAYLNVKAQEYKKLPPSVTIVTRGGASLAFFSPQRLRLAFSYMAAMAW